MRTMGLTTGAALALLCGAGGVLALTEEQCLYFAVDGKTAICHAIGSPQKPFVALEVPAQACFQHAGHPSDYVAFGDPECQGGGCLPASAPCDATLPCCEGLTCNSGICGLPVEDATTDGDGAACEQEARTADAP